MTAYVSIATVLECVSAAFGVSVRDLRSAKRPQDIAHARQAAYLLAHELTKHGKSGIGRVLGGRDHTTIIDGLKKAQERCEYDDHYAAKVSAARQAALIVANSSLGKCFTDVDPIAAAERVCRDPQWEATRISSDAILAMAVRLLDLEDAAGATFQLLLKIDDVAALGSSCSAATPLRRRELALAIRSLTETLSSALGALGYRIPEEAEENDRANVQSVA